MAIKKIGIVATARAYYPEKLAIAIQDLKAWGFEVLIGKSIGAVDHQFAGSDELRASDLEAMLKNPDIDAVLCAKGGYGTARILDLIDWNNCTEKPILGFSDITALHCHVHNLGWKSAHTIMGSTWKNATNETLSSVKQYLCNESIEYEFSGHSFNRKGTTKATVIGGNLSVIYSIMGSASEVDLDGKILFIEDLDEYLYHTDRMMLCLKRAGKFDNLAGLLVGGFTKMHDNDIPFGKSAYSIIQSHVKTFDYPMAFGIPCGHQKDNRTLVFGTQAELIVDAANIVLKF